MNAAYHQQQQVKALGTLKCPIISSGVFLISSTDFKMFRISKNRKWKNYTALLGTIVLFPIREVEAHTDMNSAGVRDPAK